MSYLEMSILDVPAILLNETVFLFDIEISIPCELFHLQIFFPIVYEKKEAR